MVKLILNEGGIQSEQLFEGDEITIGRSGRNDLVLEDPASSRFHCRLKRCGHSFTLIDVGSQNGTRVNGRLVLRQELDSGDLITIGSISIYFESVPDLNRTVAADSVPVAVDESMLMELQKERSSLLKLQDVNSAINSEMNLASLLERIIDSVIEMTGAERGFLIIVKDGEMEFESARNFKETEVDRPDLAISRSIARNVIDGKKPVLVVNARDDNRFKAVQSISNMGLRSVLCAPLTLKREVIGAVYVDNRMDKGVFSESDLSVLESFADQAAIAINNARQMSELKGKNAELGRAKADVERMNKRLSRTIRSQETEIKKTRASLERARRNSESRDHFGGIVGRSPAMTEILGILERVIASDYPVLIQGESGTGKELVAGAIHFHSLRADQPFVTESCAALPDNLLESELFGHKRGSFTGAVSNRKGLLEAADKGTFFLDEVGEMSPQMQKKMLRFLQEGEFRPVGGANPVRVDVRVVSASNADLLKMVGEGTFRQDLFYRLNVLPINIPPLRSRKEDIALLTEHFLTVLCEENGLVEKKIEPEVIELFHSYSWPGNVRELENEMRRLITLSGNVIRADLVSSMIKSGRTAGLTPEEMDGLSLNDKVYAMEELEIVRAVKESRGNKSRAARKLGISRFTLQRKIDKYGLVVE